jgi:hypothetical protein
VAGSTRVSLDNRLQTFEYGMWQILARHGVPSSVQAKIGNELIALVRDFLPRQAPTGNTTKRVRRAEYATGTSVHFFESTAAVFSICKRMDRERLRSNRITYDRTLVTCQHCIKSLPIRLDSSVGSGYTGAERN